MQGCSLEAAFPAGDSNESSKAASTVGCIDDTATQNQRRSEKRKTKRCRFTDTDPDRPSFRKITGPPPLINAAQFNESNQQFESIQQPSLKRPVSDYEPVEGVPSWFGSSAHDEEEPFMPYTGAESNIDINEYNLKPDFTASFAGGGLEKSAGTPLPTPSINDSWKTLTPTGAQSAFFENLPVPGGLLPQNMSGDMKKQIDKILARLDDLEHMKYSSEYASSEVFMIIASGLFLMFCMDVLARKK
jgi:hypothetical protein